MGLASVCHAAPGTSAALEHLSGAAASGLGVASMPSHSWVWEHGSTGQMAPWFSIRSQMQQFQKINQYCHYLY